MDFTQIMELCNKIKSINSTNEKKEFLASITDEDFKNFLKWMYDSSIVSGISDKKINKVLADDMFNDSDWTTCDVKTIFDVFRYLESHKTGKDEDIRTVQWYRNQICKNDEEVKFFNNVVTKNVIIGCDVKLINSVWKGLIPTFDVMLANSYFKLNESQWNKISKNGTRDFNILTKYDGFRCVAIKENGSVRLVSRQGKIYERCVDIEKAIKELPYDNFVLDSEILISNRKRYPSTEQYKATSNIVTLKDEDKHGVTLNCFDCIDLEEWKSGVGVTPWTERREDLENVLKNYKDSDDKPLYVAPILYSGNDLNVALSLLDKARTNQEEGVMLRFNDSVYEFKRSNELLKFKVMSEMDVYIKGYEEGTNKNVGKLGAFICEIEHPTFGHLEMKVGSGYSEEDRINYWEHKDELIGRVLEMQYFEVTSNADGGKSVRFPVHKCIKPIGTEPNN
jgi:DNA ligase-1